MYATRGSVSRTCSIHILDCVQDAQMIKYLASVAARQKAEFVQIFPWEKACVDKDKIYVALETLGSASGSASASASRCAPRKSPITTTNRKIPPKICGWMHVTFKNQRNRHIAYIHNVSTAQTLTTRGARKYKGIGTSLISKIEESAPDFIALFAITSAQSFYEKLGFVKFADNIQYMYKVINPHRPPTAANIEDMRKQHNKDIKKQENLDKKELRQTLHTIASQLKPKNVPKFWKLVNGSEENRDMAIEMYESEEATIKDIDEWVALM